jgi:site-specific recombinase XerD
MKIVLHHNRRKKDRFNIEFEVYLSRTDRVYIPTSVQVDPQHWDLRSSSVKHTHPEFSMLNTKIKYLRKKLDEIEERYLKSDTVLTGAILRLELSSKVTATTFNQFMSEQIEVDRPSVAILTYKKWKYVLKSFDEFRHVPLSLCDTDLIREYHNFLLTRMKNTSTGKNHKTLNKYFIRAKESGLIKANPYDKFSIPKDARREEFLTSDQLDIIRNKKLYSERLEVVRDMFLFMCNTGMEYIDMKKLCAEEIKDIADKKYIVKARIKEGRGMQAIPLFPEAIEIINKYSTGKGKVFPIRSNQKINDYLKEIAVLCGIEMNLSTILARHTFATLMLTMGMPIETVSHMLGHLNIKTTKDHYAKLVVAKIANDITRLNISGV